MDYIDYRALTIQQYAILALLVLPFVIAFGVKVTGWFITLVEDLFGGWGWILLLIALVVTCSVYGPRPAFAAPPA